MMSPIPLETASALIHMGYSRELILNTIIAAIRVEGASQIQEYRNDPFGEPDAAICSEADQFYGPKGFLNGSPYAPEVRQSNLDTCEYHIFQFYLQAAMNWGFNIQVKTDPKSCIYSRRGETGEGFGRSHPPKLSLRRSCFDPAFAKPGVERSLKDNSGPMWLNFARKKATSDKPAEPHSDISKW